MTKGTHMLKMIQSLVPEEEDDILVLAGDIGTPYKKHYRACLAHVNTHFKKTFLIPGNHEYYGNLYTIEEIHAMIEDLVKEFPNIVYLQNSSTVYGGYRFIGTILWSSINDSKYTINDTRMIKNLTIENYQKRHEECMDYLEKEVDKSIEPVIVLTHHMPSYNLIGSMYLTGDMKHYNQWFATDLNSFIEKYRNKIKAWIYGHTHTASKKELYGVPMLCNPVGYPGENPFSTILQTFVLS
jgi:predicted phosphohydrolase